MRYNLKRNNYNSSLYKLANIIIFQKIFIMIKSITNKTYVLFYRINFTNIIGLPT